MKSVQTINYRIVSLIKLYLTKVVAVREFSVNNKILIDKSIHFLKSKGF